MAFFSLDRHNIVKEFPHSLSGWPEGLSDRMKEKLSEG